MKIIGNYSTYAITIPLHPDHNCCTRPGTTCNIFTHKLGQIHTFTLRQRSWIPQMERINFSYLPMGQRKLPPSHTTIGSTSSPNYLTAQLEEQKYMCSITTDSHTNIINPWLMLRSNMTSVHIKKLKLNRHRHGIKISDHPNLCFHSLCSIAYHKTGPKRNEVILQGKSDVYIISPRK